MIINRLVAIPCRTKQGSFPSERLVELRLANDELFYTICPSHFCWDSKGVLLDSATTANEINSGWLAAKFIDQIDDSQILVEIPQGQRVVVKKELVIARPTEIRPKTTISY